MNEHTGHNVCQQKVLHASFGDNLCCECEPHEGCEFMTEQTLKTLERVLDDRLAVRKFLMASKPFRPTASHRNEEEITAMRDAIQKLQAAEKLAQAVRDHTALGSCDCGLIFAVLEVYEGVK